MRLSILWPGCLFALLHLSCPTRAAGGYVAPLMVHAPTIDGRIDPAEWQGAVRIEGLQWNGVLERRRAVAYVGATPTHLYLALLSRLPDEGSLVADVDRVSENLIFDDSAEVWLTPTPGAEAGLQYQMLTNSRGHAWYRQHGTGPAQPDPAWRGDWQVRSQVRADGWHLEVAIPVAGLGARDTTLGEWGLNLCRNWKQDWGWSCLGGDMYRPTQRFTFVEANAPEVALRHEGDAYSGQIACGVTLANPGVSPLSLMAEATVTRDLMPGLHTRQAITLQPGQSREVMLQATDGTSRKLTETVKVTSADGFTTYAERTMAWTAEPGKPWRWVAAKRVIPPLDFRFAYHPYSGILRISADASNLPPAAHADSVRVVLRRKGGAAVRTFEMRHLVNGKQELRVAAPGLKGEYELALTAHGAGVPAAGVVKPLTRRLFAWEHNRLGLGERVYPPFTPITVRDNRVGVVLRSHTMGPTGLWQQVTARGKELLAAPMHYEATLAGRRLPIRATGTQFTRVSGYRSTARAFFTMGQVAGTARITWDYDGAMRVDLGLAPTGRPARLDGLTLVVPLKPEQCTHLHAMGDGIRNTIYRQVPQGNGVVWDAGQVQANDLPARFCSYLYLGTPVRGLCWFAENDRGWGWDRSTPNLQVVRKPGVTELQIRLVNRPETLSAPRTLTFGLQAAPVKPRLSSNWQHRYRRDNYSLLGTDINWLALGDCGSVYPAGYDLGLWRAIARGNREHLTDQEVQAVVDRGRRYFEPYGPDRVRTFEAHARHNVTGRYGTRMVYYYNRASYQQAPEFQVFEDEWGLNNYRSVGPGNGIGEIKIVPSQSYTDHALYWYGKSFDVGGNQGVYWDNWFFVGDYNTERGYAYRDPAGRVVPGTGLWGMRELAKRTFQYMNERGMVPITMAHMTSTSILPMLSFATVQYDWEWKYSEGDVQYRYPREYLQLVSTGELAGAWPVLLNDHGPEADDPKVGRTFAGVAMLHELDCPYAGYTETGKQQLALLKPVDEILARKGVRAYRYWDDTPPPVRSSDPDLPTIVYTLPGKEALVGIVSYATGPRDAEFAIDAREFGMRDAIRVTDAESGGEIRADGGVVRLAIPKHGVRLLRLVPSP